MAHPSLLYDEMGGMENLRYFARLYEIEDEQRCARTIAAVGLDLTLRRPVGQYSQGMRQRMSLARALIHDPGILLLRMPLIAGQPFHSMSHCQLHNFSGVFVGTMSAAMLWCLATIFLWRETPAERAQRLAKAGADVPVCPTCGYNMTGLTEARCPECGAQFTLNELLAGQPSRAPAEIEAP